METIAINTESANLTDEQFFQICNQNKEIKFERDAYKNIYIMSPTGSLTGNYHIAIAGRLWLWNENKKNGFVFDSSAGFTLPDGSIFAPDVAWISKERWVNVPLADKKRFAPICPDFIIEVLSETDSLKQQKEKMGVWIKNGCRSGWLIDIENETVYVYKQNGEIIQQTFAQPVCDNDVLLDFSLNLKDLL